VSKRATHSLTIAVARLEFAVTEGILDGLRKSLTKKQVLRKIHQRDKVDPGGGNMSTSILQQVKVADEVWIATALLHREHPSAQDFSIEEIVDRAREEGLHKPLRPGVYVHVVQHCVANRAPNPGRYRMLYEPSEGRRRLYRESDPHHPDREGGKIVPDPTDIPAVYRELLDWYRGWSVEAARRLAESDPLLASLGSGKKLWADEPADDYVRRLREGWE
jgi:hypothetical protein